MLAVVLHAHEKHTSTNGRRSPYACQQVDVSLGELYRRGPRGSPDGTQVLLNRLCFDQDAPQGGIYVAGTTGSYRRFITLGFGANWNPAWKPGG
jgi:hypothetical protein